MGVDYSIADISLLGWVRNLIAFTKRASSSASTALFTCRHGSTAVPRCGAGCK
jgi:hypothetical protein